MCVISEPLSYKFLLREEQTKCSFLHANVLELACTLFLHCTQKAFLLSVCSPCLTLAPPTPTPPLRCCSTINISQQIDVMPSNNVSPVPVEAALQLTIMGETRFISLI